ncbi:pyroglutamyl-peptidase 1 isoform X1 [Ochotona curzoniae]|uniref:pyroglutamyl-peptidase 1 isoform X1 n=1 Tax=Ochotona curzoniae TaxID=130825 RepID=UPI001B352602|nr:pyroglutamyl-peptidase 1 isoform X1 [Ochotona curzoniae]
MEQPRKAVVVTGFGPFGEHTVNASWIAVQELEKLGLGDSVDLHVYEIPVEYQTVQKLIPALWEKHSPQVPVRLHVLHVAVPGPRPLGLRARAPAGQAVQRRPAGPRAARHHRGDAGGPGAVGPQSGLLSLTAAGCRGPRLLPRLPDLGNTSSPQPGAGAGTPCPETGSLLRRHLEARPSVCGGTQPRLVVSTAVSTFTFSSLLESKPARRTLSRESADGHPPGACELGCGIPSPFLREGGDAVKAPWCPRGGPVPRAQGLYLDQGVCVCVCVCVCVPVLACDRLSLGPGQVPACFSRRRGRRQPTARVHVCWPWESSPREAKCCSIFPGDFDLDHAVGRTVLHVLGGNRSPPFCPAQPPSTCWALDPRGVRACVRARVRSSPSCFLSSIIIVIIVAITSPGLHACQWGGEH